MIEQKPMTSEEKKFLIGSQVGGIFVSLLLLAGVIFFIVNGALNFNYLSDEKKFMIFLYPIIFLVVVAIQLPSILKIFKDISSKTVSETKGIITDQGRGLSVYDRYIKIDSFGDTKIKNLRISKLPADKATFRVATHSKMLLPFPKK